ncbi:MAG TPA: hypothetical protein VFJ13_02990 [Paracoccaceae bacterium]|nr:hypothetical protein [Paracoccaceae bacterium]
MSERTERNLDAALAALARDVADTAPRPGDALTASVMADAALTALAREAAESAPRPSGALAASVLADAALTMLARETAEAAPKPGPDLVARVLADAATVAAESPAAAPASRRRTGATPAGLGLLDRLFGWQAGAIAAMTLALGLGLGVGLELEPGAVPILDEGAPAIPISLASLDADFMEVDGL